MPLLQNRFGLFRLSLFRAAGTFLLAVGVLATQAQAPAPARPLAGTYRYTAYTVFDAESPNEPTAVRGVGGILTLRPDGTYAKRLTLALGTRTIPFSQDGTYTLAADSIRFSFRDRKGADVQRGTTRLDSIGQHLTLTILGYPAGNQGVYELEAVPAAVVAPAPIPAVSPPRSKPARKRRR